jgi:hypothetical protein
MSTNYTFTQMNMLTDLFLFIDSLWFPGVAVVKGLPASEEDARDTGLIPGSGRFPGVGNGNPVQYSFRGICDGQKSLMGYSPWVTKSWI